MLVSKPILGAQLIKKSVTKYVLSKLCGQVNLENGANEIKIKNISRKSQEKHQMFIKCLCYGIIIKICMLNTKTNKYYAHKKK